MSTNEETNLNKKFTSYDQEKLQRLRARASMLAADLMLAREDLREVHMPELRAAKSALERLEREGPRDPDKEYINQRERAQARMRKAQETVDATEGRVAETSDKVQRIGSLVSRLEQAVRSWGLDLPPELRVSSPGSYRVPSTQQIQN